METANQLINPADINELAANNANPIDFDIQEAIMSLS